MDSIRSSCSFLGIIVTLFVLLLTISPSTSLRTTNARSFQNKLSYASSCSNFCPFERISLSSFNGEYDAVPSITLLLQVNGSLSTATGYKSSFLDPMLTSAGNVSTYLDQNHTVPTRVFVAGSTVYVKGEGWPIHVNITLSFTLGEAGEITVPVVVSTTVVQTDSGGSFASSLKLAANGPLGLWKVEAELTSDTNSSSTFFVYLPTPTPPSLLIPGLIGILLGVAGLVGFLYLRRRADKANYYSAQKRSQKITFR